MAVDKVKLTDSSVIELIRDSMPTATRQAKGLMPVITEKSPYQQYILLNKDLEMEFDYSYGMIALWSTQKGYSSIILLGTFAIKIVSEISGVGFSLSTVKDAVGNVNIYKTEENKFVVQNNSNDQFRFYISYQ
ncbi:hypothetical protein [Bacteroides cellulosilyticus]|uniref:hypothetical protein n=1 Tax=Bacteroides cellulosilyticus TaxID=246787 RepID=UPI000E4CB137|nr:hypothetical protein [Bacteroides cellulosilyticus]RGU27346.1 hypothetical protein DWW88_11165 [Bacteroides cellulosilyticus]